MTRVAVRAVLFSTCILALAACEDGVNLGGSGSGEAAAPGVTITQTGTRDIERPDIFSTEEEALWDGRPSLGGIWVAHPDVTSPERAIITNKATGQNIAGALFRRERSNPGPRIQLSSDAAAALNILAGQPTEVTVVAVRQEEIEIEPEDPVISDEEIGEDGETEGEATEEATEEAAERPRGNFFQRLFGRRQPAEAAASAAATADGAAAPAVETKTLDPVASGAAAAIARAEADDKPVARPDRSAAAEAPASTDTIETEAAAAEPAPAPTTSLRNPYIQVGLYSVEANAFSARDNLRQAGIVPTVLTGERNDAPFWRIVVGPVTNANEQSEMLAQVRSLGFRDAFLTSE